MKQLKPETNSNDKNFDTYIKNMDNGLSYILAIPKQLKDNCQLIVESYNSGNNQTKSYEENISFALNNLNQLKRLMMVTEGDPILIPIVPDIEGGPDDQQLSRESILRNRIEEKFFNCIQNAKEIIKKNTGKEVNEKIFLNGYSASGVFAQRFALIHPEIIDRCLIGGAAGTIPMPQINDEIAYPIGINDYEELFGKKFSFEEYKKIQFGYYAAENEEKEPGNYDINGDIIVNASQIPAPMHDMSFRGLTTTKKVGEDQRKKYGETMNERYWRAIDNYKTMGINISGIILRDATHDGIFNSMQTKCFPYLKSQLLQFYNKREDLKPELGNCVNEINGHYQKRRNESNDKSRE